MPPLLIAFAVCFVFTLKRLFFVFNNGLRFSVMGFYILLQHALVFTTGDLGSAPLPHSSPRARSPTGLPAGVPEIPICEGRFPTEHVGA